MRGNHASRTVRGWLPRSTSQRTWRPANALDTYRRGVRGSPGQVPWALGFAGLGICEERWAAPKRLARLAHGCFVAPRILAEKAPVEEARVALGFEPEPCVELLAESPVTDDDRLAEAEACLGAHRETMGGPIFGVERDRPFGSCQGAGCVVMGEPDLAELVQEIDHLGAQVAHLAGRPWVVRAGEWPAANERERPLEEPLAGYVALRVRLREEEVKLVDVDCDGGAVEEVVISRAGKDIAELGAHFAD